jgi:hypothetical protein
VEYTRAGPPQFKLAAEQQPNRTPLLLRFHPQSSARLKGDHVRHARHAVSGAERRAKTHALTRRYLDHAISFSFQLQCSPRGWQASQLGNPAVGTSVLFKLIVSSSSSPTSSSTSLIPKPRRMRRNEKREGVGPGAHIYGQVTHRPHAEPVRWQDDESRAGEIDG